VTPKIETCDPNTLRAQCRKRLEIGTPFKKTSNSKWPMGNRMVMADFSVKSALPRLLHY